MSADLDHQLLKPKEVADLLRVDARTVRSYGATGLLDVIRLNSRVLRYSRGSVARLMQLDGGEGGTTMTDAAWERYRELFKRLEAAHWADCSLEDLLADLHVEREAAKTRGDQEADDALGAIVGRAHTKLEREEAKFAEHFCVDLHQPQ